MNKLKNFLLLTLCILAFSEASAQQFYFSTERPASCNAQDGIVSIVPTRGVPPFTYLWNNGSTEVSLRNLPKGTYTATLTDATGATISHTQILNSEEFDLNLSAHLPSGGCNPNSGALTVSPVAGVSPYTFTWSNGQTDASIQGLSSGVYGLTVVDGAGCSAEAEYVVSDLPGLYGQYAQIASVNQPDCGNLMSGKLEAFLYASNYPPFTYTWNNGSTSQTNSNLSAGYYSVTITDALGCNAVSGFILKNNLDTTNSVVCSGGNTGSVSANLINATAPVTYVWSTGQTGPSLSNLSSGYYYVTATDANGCTSDAYAKVAIPEFYGYDNSQKCFSGNNGIGFCSVNDDQPVSFLWDNGGTDYWNYSLSPGAHTVTITTALGCTLSGSITIAQPTAPAITLATAPTPADCANGLGGALNLTVSGGIQPLSFYVYGPDGFVTSDISSLQNLQGGDYYISAYSPNYVCYANASSTVQDAGGFTPSLVVNQLDCVTGYGSAAVINATTPNTQYEWSTGATTAGLFNLTQGCYSVTVSAGASCNKYYEFCLYSDDSLQINPCTARATGQLINDLGAPGCSGTTGIPYQLIRTQPSGALNFTDANGLYQALLPAGTFDLEPAQYDPADIACPVNGKYTLNTTIGSIITGLDFHFLNNNPLDLRVKQTPLRTAQPGYPFSLRLEVCNDGAAATPGALDIEYGSFLGPLTGHQFAQHTGAFSLTNETAGIPNNSGTFTMPNINPGQCELLQLDLATPTTTPVNTAFVNNAQISPSGGDPTPSNNTSTLYNTVAGSFDPNVVLSFPARNGNPKDGGQIIQNEDNTLVYQIFFQNTGNAAADLVIVRDSLDENLNLASIHNITASHDMKVLTEVDNKVLVFKFENIHLPDSTSDYAGSIGFIQYAIDLKPGVVPGTEIKKQAGIFFDFNPPVITNQNVLKLVTTTKTQQLVSKDAVEVFPNPTDASFGIYCDGPSNIILYNAMGKQVLNQKTDAGLQQIFTADLPNGIYLIQLDTNGKKRSGKVIVTH